MFDKTTDYMSGFRSNYQAVFNPQIIGLVFVEFLFDEPEGELVRAQ